MNRDDIQKLLGGYATGTLTPEEQQILFEAALEDQDLFDALAREQALRDLLQDPAARGLVLAALDEKREPWYARWWRPAAMAMSTAGVAVLSLVLVRNSTRPAPPPAATSVAEVKPSEVKPSEVSPPAPSPERRKVLEAEQQTDVRRKPVDLQAFRKELAAQPAKSAPDALPAAPAIRDAQQGGVAGGRPGGVVGGVIGGVPSALPPPPPPRAESLAKSAPAPVVSELADVFGNRSARALFFASAGNQFLAPQFALPGQPADSTASLAAPSRPDSVPPVTGAPVSPGKDSEKEQKQRAVAEQARNMMRNSAAVTARVVPPNTTAMSIRYTILRKTEDGSFAEAAPGEIKPGDPIEVRFEANQPGYLSVLSSASRPIVAMYLGRRAPYTSAPIDAGLDALTVRFSRAPLTGGSRPSGAVLETPADASDKATYVAAGEPASDPLVFTISLKRP